MTTPIAHLQCHPCSLFTLKDKYTSRAIGSQFTRSTPNSSQIRECLTFNVCHFFLNRSILDALVIFWRLLEKVGPKYPKIWKCLSSLWPTLNDHQI
jgi:hypothetical protein